MTGDPERLLNTADADPFERELLGSVRRVGPPEGAKARAWRGIAGQVAVGAVVGAVSSSSAAAASKASAGNFATWALSTKVALVAAGGLALGGGYLALQSASPAAPGKLTSDVASHARPAAPLSVPRTPEMPVAPEAVLAPAPRAEQTPTEDAANHKLEPRRLDSLKAESALLTEARAELRSGNPAAAQASLDRLQAQFPKGVLTQEREVLGIEVSYARGNIEGAKRRAKAFVKAYPSSPHSAKLSRFLD